MRKTWLCLLMIPLLLSACTGDGEALTQQQTAQEEARQVRTEYLAADSCSGTVEVTADYGLRVYEFTLDFLLQREGQTSLTVVAPEELAGLSARIGPEESRLEFDGVSLNTGDLTGEGLTPIELLPALMDDICAGYMSECLFETLEERETLRVLFRDPEEEADAGTDCIQWFDRTTHALLRAELYRNGELVLAGNFTEFSLQTSAPEQEAP